MLALWSEIGQGVVLVTGEEGRSELAVGLAAAAAAAGRKGALIECDFAAPGLANALGLDPVPGFARVPRARGRGAGDPPGLDPRRTGVDARRGAAGLHRRRRRRPRSAPSSSPPRASATRSRNFAPPTTSPSSTGRRSTTRTPSGPPPPGRTGSSLCSAKSRVPRGLRDIVDRRRRAGSPRGRSARGRPRAARPPRRSGRRRRRRRRSPGGRDLPRQRQTLIASATAAARKAIAGTR